ncbi:MAG: GIY-YIG nuclease family protein [Pseudomonadota bacterium]
MLSFQSILALEGVEPKTVNAMLHSPREPSLRRVFPALAKDQPEIVEAYQATHSPQAERALKKGRPYVAVFLASGDVRPDKRRPMLFLGMYENRGHRPVSLADLRARPEVQYLIDVHSVDYTDRWGDDGHLTWFDLKRSPLLDHYAGRLTCTIKLTQNYLRVAENLDAPVLSLSEDSAFDAPPPPWRDWIVTAGELRALPISWADRLSAWRGIYLIIDAMDGARYVGSAYGETNLLGRWSAHVAGDLGVTAHLKTRSPDHFQFSILERMGPDTPADEVIAREMTWIARLGTKTYGLNT